MNGSNLLGKYRSISSSLSYRQMTTMASVVSKEKKTFKLLFYINSRGVLGH